MISNLSIRNLAIIDALEVDFSQGMIVLTGETGAGKSILLDALNLVLGQRASSDLIRHGESKAEVSATFNIATLPQAKKWLTEQELHDDDECVIRRVLNENGTSKAWINGSPTNLSTLQQLSQQLINIHSQHAHQSLLKLEAQRQILDDFGHHDLSSLHQAYQRYKQSLAHKKALAHLNQSESQIELLNYQLEELNQLAPQADEWETLDKQHQQQHQSERFISDCNQAVQLLSHDHGVITQLSQGISALQTHQATFPHIENLCEIMQLALTHSEEAYKEAQVATDRIEVDEQQRHEIEQRLSMWHDLARKHQIPPSELAEHHQQLQQQQEKFLNASQSLAQMDEDILTAFKDWKKEAQRLTQQRQTTIKALCDFINDHLEALNLRRSISIELQSNAEQVQSHGQDTVTFHFQPNAGQSPKPLHKIASGGELSRVHLAIAVSIAQTSNHPCLVFDEVDVGIGGATAEVVGQMLHDISKQSQTLIITHQAQVAAQADHHLHLFKSERDQKTFTAIAPLLGDDRTTEIARMIGGIKLTENTIARAKEMLNPLLR